MSEANKAVVRAYFDAVNQGQLTDALLAHFTDDVTWWIQQASPTAGTYRGKEGLMRLFRADRPIFSAPLHVEIGRMVAEGDCVATEAEITTRNVRGKAYRNQYTFWMDIRDGKICRVREYLDTLYAQQILFDPADIPPTAH